MIIHITKKLASKLQKAGFEVPAKSERQSSLLGDWHANITTIQRRQCIVFTHDQTRFTMALTGVTLKEIKNLNWWFNDLLANTMLKMDYPEALIKKALDATGELHFDTDCSRSVQGTLRLMINGLESYTWDGTDIMDLGIYSLSRRLCDRPCNVKGQKECLWPTREMKAFLEALPYTDEEIDLSIVR